MHRFYIRKYEEEDIGGILALFEHSFNKKASEEWFRWKYQGSPSGSQGYVARDKNTVVAFYGGIRLQFTFNGEPLWAYQFSDVMTHPQYRGRIISKTPLIARLGDLFYRENTMDFAYGFPSLRHARLQSLILGGEGYRLIREYKKEALRRHRLQWKLKVREGWECLQKEDLDRFCNGIGKKRPSQSARGSTWMGGALLQMVKDEPYMRWRYSEHPSKTYGLLVFRKMSRAKGYVIFTVEDTRFHVLEILHEREKDARDILVALEGYITRSMGSIQSMHMWFHPNEQAIHDLDRLGYNAEEGIPLAFRSVNKACGVSSGTFYERYFYRMGDYDAS